MSPAPSLPSFLRPGKPDIGELKEWRDTPGLIRALRHPDLGVQWEATTALGSLGPEAMEELLRRLPDRNRSVKLGIIEALGEIRDARAVAPLLPGLRDPDRYVRYGTALALRELGWAPADDRERGLFLLGLQEWDGLEALGPPAVPALELALKDREREVRVQAVEILGRIGDTSAAPALLQALQDGDDGVRWRAVLAGPRCGVAPLSLPRGLSQRPRPRKNPSVAAFLNFILPGQGYLYLGRWWGVLVFQVDITATLWLFAALGDQFTYELLLPIYAFVSIHAWYLATRLPEM